MTIIIDSDENIWEYSESDRIFRSPSSTVYRGRGDDDRSVAIKVIDSDGKPVNLAYDRREILIGAKLSSGNSPAQHLLLPLGTFQDDQFTYIIMPLAEYSLREYQDETKLSVSEKIAILRQIALGLQELALVNVWHRDLKPGNVLYIDKRWRVADFGISRDLDHQTNQYTFKGSGTLEYRAPEVSIDGYTSTKSDLYSLGVVAFELIVGHLPFQDPDGAELVRQHRESPVPDLPPEVPLPLRRLVVQLMDKDPARRPADAREVVDLLAAVEAPRTGAQQALQRLAMTVERRESALQAATAAQQGLQERIEQVRVDGVYALKRITAEVSDLFSGQLGAEVEVHDALVEPGVFFLRWKDFEMRIEVHRLRGVPDVDPLQEIPDGHPMLMGAVFTYIPPWDSFAHTPPRADTVYAWDEQQGRWAWQLRRWHDGSAMRGLQIQPLNTELAAEAAGGKGSQPDAVTTPLTAEALIQLCLEFVEQW
ncbi:serine/threonine-protein kinase [Nocardia abscessus]|uniref:serine/threonine-protein kinase n=1 Tax=Nocardia abscessus TaxID=120957 RepID=UPI00245725EA|nr:serine/threonine-protein kinase [Nocardia abscessus]